MIENSFSFRILLGAIILGIPASLALSFWLGRKALTTLRSGVAVSMSRAEYRRTRTPLLYWLVASLQFFNAAACVLIALALLALPLLGLRKSVPPLGQRETGKKAMETALKSGHNDSQSLGIKAPAPTNTLKSPALRAGPTFPQSSAPPRP